MTEKPRRPTFDDPLPTEPPSHPVHGPDPTGHPHLDGMTEPATEKTGVALTLEESALASSAVFAPTVRRMAVLLGTLVQIVENGDMVLWAPLAAMDLALRDLKWTSVPPRNVARFHALMGQTLIHYGSKFAAYADVVAALEPGAVLPDLPTWTEAETLEMYDIVETLYARPEGVEP